MENDDPGISSQINKDLEALEKNITKTFDRIKFEATVTAKIIKLTSRNSTKQFIALIVAAFCSGVLMTTLVYHAFINGIMSRNNDDKFVHDFTERVVLSALGHTETLKNQ